MVIIMESEEFGLVLGEKLLGLEALHYGYWDTQPKEEKNFTIIEIIKAQKKYSDFILAQIDRQLKKQFPKKFTSQSAKQSVRILDVGCGTGIILCELLKKGYSVDAVIPSIPLQKRVEAKIKILRPKSKPQIYSSKFEEMLENKDFSKYDLIFFSESFQYIPMKDNFIVLDKLLKKNGTVLISDFFKKQAHNPEHTHLVGGGWLLKDFVSELKNSSFTKTQELDITKNCSPTIEIGSYILAKRLYPSLQLLDQFLQTRYKKKYLLLKKSIAFFGKKSFQKFKKKYLLGKRTGLAFEKNNKYLVAILKRNL